MKNAIRLSCSALVAAGSLFMASGAMAQAGTPQQYQRERAVCDGIQQDRAACLREAGAAKDAANKGALTTPAPTTAEQNALARCDLQPPQDQRACVDRVRGTGVTAIEGSVMGGGAIRETVTPIPAPVPTQAVAPVMMQSPPPPPVVVYPAPVEVAPRPMPAPIR